MYFFLIFISEEGYGTNYARFLVGGYDDGGKTPFAIA